jgi:beta-ureidopropionase
MKKKIISRRDFFQAGALASGGVLLDPLSAQISGAPALSAKLAREVWIAGFSMMDLEAPAPEEQAQQVLAELKKLQSQSPDIICLPETFPFMGVSKPTTVEEKLSISKKLFPQFSDFANQNNCYVICPMYTSEAGKAYNAAVLFDRKGSRAGEYRKARVTDYEIADGITPGPLVPPVFKTDFGVIGIQICWDIAWDMGWKELRKKGAEIIFWPSAFSGGRMINTMAWQHKCVVVSCTGKNTAKICDISGEEITQTGKWNPNVFCAAVNLDKIFVHTWPFVEHFSEIQNKYGRDIRFTTFHEEEWTIIESLSPRVNLKNILQEYKIPTFEEDIANTEKLQARARPA